ncbi:hypothetical protein [Mycobacterium sp. E2497]|uniref:PPE domain-containing protein n=1 Tax=Mycobacterium sp. E2497 TaxID=1834135 RepID=UPI0007FC4B65|nr:hypothetical protein [Mycobacterium sp. E2497]OBI13721.1 hypothetical protein A5713_26720 [Mycobacterium sp. E2497]
MTEPLKVRHDELVARAAELEAPLPSPPADDPAPPCDIGFIVDSATQLALSAGAIRDCVAYCERQYQILAQSLRNAAKAYEELDSAAAESMTGDSPGSSVARGPVGGSEQAAAKSAAVQPYSPPTTPPPSSDLSYYPVKQAAQHIEAPDQGPAFVKFADNWNAYALTLQQDVLPRFRPFAYWQGPSAKAAEDNFEKQKRYVIGLADNCNQLAAQARQVVSAHKWAVSEHPSSYEIYITEFWIIEYTKRNDLARRAQQVDWYQELQKKSEEVLAQYRQLANVPLAPIYPSTPPAATVIAPPVIRFSDLRGNVGGGGGTYGGGGAWSDAGTGGQLASANVADRVSGINDMVSGLTDTTADPYADAPAVSAGAPPPATGASMGGGVKPASLAGGADMPSAPLQPPVEAGSAQSGPGRGPGQGGAAPGSGGAMGGRGGMGMAPMGAGAGQGQGQDKKAKRMQDDEELYTEERPWTSSVIGIRPRNDAPEETHR